MDQFISAKKKVVITGIAGYLGSWVTKLFLDDGSFRSGAQLEIKLTRRR